MTDGVQFMHVVVKREKYINNTSTSSAFYVILITFRDHQKYDLVFNIRQAT